MKKNSKKVCKIKYDPYLTREYGVLPRFLQFYIFMKKGIYRGVGWKIKWQRLYCWRNKHKWFIHTLIDRKDCIYCGEQIIIVSKDLN